MHRSMRMLALLGLALAQIAIASPIQTNLDARPPDPWTPVQKDPQSVPLTTRPSTLKLARSPKEPVPVPCDDDPAYTCYSFPATRTWIGGNDPTATDPPALKLARSPGDAYYTTVSCPRPMKGTQRASWYPEPLTKRTFTHDGPMSTITDFTIPTGHTTFKFSFGVPLGKLTATSTQVKPKRTSIPANSGMSDPGGHVKDAFKDMRSVRKRMSDRVAPLLVEGDCSPYNASDIPAAPQVEPDIPEAFQNSSLWSDLATKARTPQNYDLAYFDLKADVSTDQSPFVMGKPLVKYDPDSCAIFCNLDPWCLAFSVAAQRVPTLRINSEDCPNPPGMSEFVCNLWQSPILSQPTLGSVYWADFKVVVAGCNVYNLKAQTLDINSSSAKRSSIAHTRRDCNGAPVVENGGFEVDDPTQVSIPTGWDISNIESSVTFGFTKDSSTNNGGTYAFKADLITPENAGNDPMSGFILSQELNTCAGRTYNVSADYRFDYVADHNCSVVVGTDTLEDNHFADRSRRREVNRWQTGNFMFTSEKPNDLLYVYVSCHGDKASNTVSIDNVVVQVAGKLHVGFHLSTRSYLTGLQPSGLNKTKPKHKEVHLMETLEKPEWWYYSLGVVGVVFLLVIVSNPGF